MKKSFLIVAAILLFFLLLWVLVDPFLFFGSGYDVDWMVGRSVKEVVDRYGPPNYSDNNYGIQVGYRVGSFRILEVDVSPGGWTNPDAIVKTAEVHFVDPEEYGSYNHLFLLQGWSENSTLEDLLSYDWAVPSFCVPGSAIVYQGEGVFSNRYLVIPLKQEMDRFAVSQEGTFTNSVDDLWQPWDPALFGIEVSPD